MKSYISKIVIFLVPLVFLAVILLTYAKQKHQFLPSSWYYYDDFEEAYRAKDMEVIALGNSKLLSALDKKTLSQNKQHKVAVLGYSSANISVSKLTLESYINTCSIMPNTVLLEVSWFTFSAERTHLHNIVGDLFIKDPRLWTHYFNYSDHLGEDIKRAFKNTITLDSKTKNANYQLSYAVKFQENTPNTVNYTFSVEDMEAVFPDHTAGVDTRLLKDYKAIVTLCVMNNIDLILFTAPEDERYSKLQKDRDEVKRIFKESANSFDNVYYLDYSLGGVLWDKTYEMWLKDSHHINEKELFTKVLVEDIKIEASNKIYR